MEKTLTQEKAGELLGLTGRQVRRLVTRVRAEGDAGLAHRGRGRPSNRRIPETVNAKALTLYEQQDGDCGPTRAAEASAPGVAGATSTCGGTDPAGWLAP
jgi:hypothetical protein